MGDREAAKKAWEIEQGSCVARELNNAEGSDYEAEASKHEPADVVLASPSRKFQPRDAQVVSIPLDFRSRDDKQTVKHVETRLRNLLTARNVRHLLVGLVMSGDAEMHGVKPALLEQLADLIANERREQNVTLRYDNIYERAPELAEMFHNIFISHHPDVIEEVSIDIPAGSAVPADGRWIEEGIRKKVERYGGENAVKDLMLIVGVAGFVDDEQVAAFRKAFTEADLPFAEIWINTPFHGTICLKQRK